MVRISHSLWKPIKILPNYSLSDLNQSIVEAPSTPPDEPISNRTSESFVISEKDINEAGPSSSSNVSEFEQIRPLPKAAAKSLVDNRKRKKKKASAILTDTPIIDQLTAEKEAIKKKKMEISEGKAKREKKKRDKEASPKIENITEAQQAKWQIFSKKKKMKAKVLKRKKTAAA
ncbi:hypothetical protein JTB14_010950 [Gonioctena quinquepunctata]|nr:hypothetical protein JTB14_010950 [Gonioctena quinquepunctata]